MLWFIQTLCSINLTKVLNCILHPRVQGFFINVEVLPPQQLCIEEQIHFEGLHIIWSQNPE